MPYTSVMPLKAPTKGKKITFTAYKTIRFDEAEKEMRRDNSSNSDREGGESHTIKVFPIEKSYENEN